MRLPKIIYFAALCALNCRGKIEVKVVSGAATSKSTETTDSGVSSATKSTALETTTGSVSIPSNAFAPDADVSLSEISAADFLTEAGLSASSSVLNRPMQFKSFLAGTSTLTEPLSPLGVVLNVSSNTSLDPDAAALVLVTATNGATTVFYVGHSNLSIATHAVTGQLYVSIGNVQSGNFSVILASGLTEAYLASNFRPLNTGGNVAAEKGLPLNAAASLGFVDTNTTGGYISGSVSISKASDESNFVSYALYWGSSATVKGSSTAISVIAKTGSNLSYTFPSNTILPSTPAATHLLIYTVNANGEMSTGTAVLIADAGVPVNGAVSMSFTDTDSDGGQIAGTVNITKSSNESDITHYVLYWGSSSSAKQSATTISTVAATGSNISATISANTNIPTGPAATHLLVYTKNADGEMATGISLLIVDLGVPLNAAASVTFTDTDVDGGQIAGIVNITKAASEADVTHYVLYWGSNSTTKQNSTPIANIIVTGGDVSQSISANTTIPTSPTATHLLVYTKNAGGEMTTGVFVAITDVGVPVNAATSMSFTDTDTDGGQVGGTVNITKAASETDVTHYVLYWGSSTTAKQSGTPIANIAITGSNVTQSISANTSIPTGPAATHLLVYTKNADGEMATGINVAIVDVGVPVNASAGVTFTDTDTTTGEIGGTVNITKAASETDVTHYVLYWGSNSTTKQSGTAIANIAVTGSNVTHSFSADTAIPTGPTATHLLVRTKNADGEMATGVNVAITDTGPSCPGGTTAVGGYCWAKTAVMQSCADKCTMLGLPSNAATISYAGSTGSDANCKLVIDTLDSINVTLTTGTGECATAGLGCSYDGLSTTYNRCTAFVTTDTALFATNRRYCACN